jgi:hypothetical protein
MAKSSTMPMGGALTLLGSLVYLYVFYTWYISGAAASTWLSSAAFLAPLIFGFGIFGVVTLFFMGIGTMMGKTPKDNAAMSKMLWKFITISAVSFLIITGGTGWFWWAFAAFILTYLGGMSVKM